jgi:HEPN domain-containing protein
MSDREHAKEILEAARRDLRALHGMNDPQVFSDEIFGFHAQQAAERALKAWLAHNGIRFPKTHDLKQLIDLCSSSPASTQVTSVHWSISMRSRCSIAMNRCSLTRKPSTEPN